MEEPGQLNWAAIHRSAGPYPPEAFAFVQHGLRYTIDQIRRHDPSMPEEGRHVSGQELCLGLRDFAVRQYGLLARTVFSRWNITQTDDFGRIVFAMVEHGLMRKTDEDSIDDFRSVYDFEEAFETLEVA